MDEAGRSRNGCGLFAYRKSAGKNGTFLTPILEPAYSDEADRIRMMLNSNDPSIWSRFR
jgi:hypothetical protein